MTDNLAELHPLNNLIGLSLKKLERFISKIKRDSASGCWIWTGSFDRKGYGKFWVSTAYANAIAHRLCYRLCSDVDIEGKHLHHICENPKCVNPYHLEPLTAKAHIHKTPQSISYQCSIRTNCPYGHPYDEENTYWSPRGKRQCLACRKARDRKETDDRRASIGKPPKVDGFCTNGHLVDGDNLYLYVKNGVTRRTCVTCRREAMRRYEKKRVRK